MSFRTTRIGSYLRNLKNSLIREVCLSKVGIYKGFRINEMSSSTPRMRIGNRQDSNDVDVIRNLNDIVKTRALYYYHAINRSIYKGYKPLMVLDWSGVQFKHYNLDYKEIYPGTEVLRTISHTVFENNSVKDQKHKVKAEIQNYSIRKTVLTEGYVIGANISCSFPIPHAKFDAGISTTYEFKSLEENTEEETRSLNIEDNITVPAGSTIKLSMILRETNSLHSLTACIGVKGDVIVRFYNHNGLIDSNCTIPMRTVINEEFPKRMTYEVDDTVYIMIKGRCEFKYEIADIVVTQ